MTADGLIRLQPGSLISRGLLFRTIIESKIPTSAAWTGESGVIHNTPLQGINWIASPPDVRAVLARSTAESYEADSWLNDSQTVFRYSMKSQKGIVNPGEPSNLVLSEQPNYRYPVILLLARPKREWRVAGHFDVVRVGSDHVELMMRH